MSEVESPPENRCCSYCKLPPRVAGKKLKRCSRCHRAWYHDAECQRKHFPLHKKDCKKWSAFIAAKNSTKKDEQPTCLISENSGGTAPSSPPTNKVCVQEREGRGKCLVVSPGMGIRKGERIRDHGNQQDFWEPLILPVLHLEHRTSRCALCFGRLPLHQPESVGSFGNRVPPRQEPHYRLLFCSTRCLEVASRKGLEREELDCSRFVQKIQGGPKPGFIYPTAILLYRILIREQGRSSDDARIRNQVLALQGKPRRDEPENSIVRNPAAILEDRNDIHARGVVAIAVGMLQCSDSMSSHYRPSMEYLLGMVHRIKVNGFSIFDGLNSENCGAGLYGTPSFMNHSCRANALQTFLFRQACPPCLSVTAFRNISQDEEITISYIDASCPSHLRKQKLEKAYHFFCACEACDSNSDQQDDSTTMAIRCLNCGAESSPPPSLCSSVVRADKGMAPGRPVYQCSKCNSTDFDSTLRQLRAFETQVLGDRRSVDVSSNELRKAYGKLRQICYENSWYVQEVGERLLEEHLEKLPVLVGDPTREQETAWAALKLGEELLANNAQSSSTRSAPAALYHRSPSWFSRHQQLRHKVAKLRLFLVPDPRQSIRELEEVLSSLRPFFPEDHAAIAEVKASLASAIM